MSLRDWPDEPCEECLAESRRLAEIRGYAVPLDGIEHAKSVLGRLAEAAHEFHGGSAGRELAESYEQAAQVLERVWKS